MPRKSASVNPDQTVTPAAEKPRREVKPRIAPTELDSIAALGPSFEAAVTALRAKMGATDAAKQAAKDALKSERRSFKKLRKAAENVVSLGL